jgi:hypothetical protein
MPARTPIITAIMGSRPSIDRIADQPSTACKNGNSTTKIPAEIPNTISSATDPDASRRSRNVRISSSG